MSLITISLGSNIEPQLNLEKAIHEIAKFAALKKPQKYTKVSQWVLRETIF